MPASYNSTVTVTIEFAFGDAWDDTTQTWVDVSSSVREFSTSRGRSRILDEVQPGKAALTLTNSSGNFSAWNTAGAYSGGVNLLTQIRIRATYNSITYDLFRGFVTSWHALWPENGADAVVRVEAVDGFHILAMVEGEFTESAEVSGTRVGNLLDTAGWPASWRAIDTGEKQIRSITAEFNTVLSELRRVQLVEDGLFYIDGAGTATFRDGHTRIEDDSIQATFSDDGAGLYYLDADVEYDDSQLWNQATVTRVGGTAQTADDTSSINQYGQRDLHLSETLHVANGEANALAEWLVSEFAEPRARAPQVVLAPEKDPANLWPAALGLDFWDKVNVERTDVTGDDFDVDCYVEGVTHNVTMVGGRLWHTTFTLSPDLPFTDWWILGTSALGTDTRLAY